MQNVRPRNNVSVECFLGWDKNWEASGVWIQIDTFPQANLVHILQSTAQCPWPATCAVDFSQIKFYICSGLFSPKLVRWIESFPSIMIFTPMWKFVLLRNCKPTGRVIWTTQQWRQRGQEEVSRWFCNVMLYGELQWNSRTSKSELDHPMHGLWWAISSYPLK